MLILGAARDGRFVCESVRTGWRGCGDAALLLIASISLPDAGIPPDGAGGGESRAALFQVCCMKCRQQHLYPTLL